MDVTVRVFASYADALGRSELDLALSPGATVEDVVQSVTRLPGGSAIPLTPLTAVNHRYVSLAAELNDGDEVALIPPVAGG